MAFRPTRNASSVVKPCSTSCTTGRQVTTSSKSTICSRTSLWGRRNTSIHADVSTRTTATPRLVFRTVLPDDGEVPFPRPAARELENLPRAGAAHEVLHGALDGARVRPLVAH